MEQRLSKKTERACPAFSAYHIEVSKTFKLTMETVENSKLEQNPFVLCQRGVYFTGLDREVDVDANTLLRGKHVLSGCSFASDVSAIVYIATLYNVTP